jgi:site-specific DNA-methyltransferase (cytosine-N4-specific)
MTATNHSPYWSSENAELWELDTSQPWLPIASASVDCILTSPPYYGQRDYAVEGQLGLEQEPTTYVARLVDSLNEAKRVLKPEGSLWVNIGDTYWSGKGEPKGSDRKQKHRRFKRPQDYSSSVKWCVPKQLLLIPHRFAIAMQDAGWILREDIVWNKLHGAPDPVQDRSARHHEYIFHFVKRRKYFYDPSAVSEGTNGKQPTLSSVWNVQTDRSRRAHKAMFPEALARIPVAMTCPRGGTFLDPYCGSATALAVALATGAKKAIGIDLSKEALAEARKRLESGD